MGDGRVTHATAYALARLVYAADPAKGMFPPSQMSAAKVRSYQPVWLACAVFIAKGTRAKPASPEPAVAGLSLSRVLTVLKVSEAQFFRELDQFLERGAPVLVPGTAGGALMDADAAADLPRRLNVKPLASMYILSSWSANRYRIMFARFFKAPECTPVRPQLLPTPPVSVERVKSLDYSCPWGPLVPQVFDFGWLLFIVAKQRLLQPFTDLVSSVSVLVRL
jgi:hypothetical protein